MVPETQNPKTVSFQHLGSPGIGSFLLEVLATVQLNDKGLIETTEIDDKTSDRMLTAELEPDFLIFSPKFLI